MRHAMMNTMNQVRFVALKLGAYRFYNHHHSFNCTWGHHIATFLRRTVTDMEPLFSNNALPLLRQTRRSLLDHVLRVLNVDHAATYESKCFFNERHTQLYTYPLGTIQNIHTSKDAYPDKCICVLPNLQS